jgi:hypothetical protein
MIIRSFIIPFAYVFVISALLRCNTSFRSGSRTADADDMSGTSEASEVPQLTNRPTLCNAKVGRGGPGADIPPLLPVESARSLVHITIKTGFNRSLVDGREGQAVLVFERAKRPTQ